MTVGTGSEVQSNLNSPLPWRARSTMLQPQALVVTGADRKQILRQLLTREDSELEALQGVHNSHLILVAGPMALLPWFPGALLLGIDDAAPQLLLPIHQAPAVPLDLLQCSLQQRFGAGPHALLPSPDRSIPMASARQLSRTVLQQLESLA